MKYSDAFTICDWLVDEFRHTAIRIEPAGSVRRHKDLVHDLEIVVMPKDELVPPQFGKKYVRQTLLDEAVERLIQKGELKLVKGGPKYKQLSIECLLTSFGIPVPINKFCLDLFIVTPPAQWGIIFTIRTGPGSVQDNFSRWIVTQKKYGGALPDGYRIKHGAIWLESQLDSKGEPKRGEISNFPMPEEQDFFNFLELDWIEPKDRHAPSFPSF